MGWNQPSKALKQWMDDRYAKVSVVAPVAATTSVLGTVKKAAHITNLGSAPTAADFNGLLAAMQTAGQMA